MVSLVFESGIHHVITCFENYFFATQIKPIHCVQIKYRLIKTCCQKDSIGTMLYLQEKTSFLQGMFVCYLQYLPTNQLLKENLSIVLLKTYDLRMPLLRTGTGRGYFFLISLKTKL